MHPLICKEQRMNRECIELSDFRPNFDNALLAEKSGLPIAEVAKLAAEAAQNCSGKGCAIICSCQTGAGDTVLICERPFTSPLLSEKLAGLGRVFPYLVTEGAKMAAWGAGYKGKPEAQLVHLLRQTAVKACEAEIERRLCERFGIAILSSLNPGSLRDWPISEQQNLLVLLDPLPAKLGVSLLPSGIMQPDYSVSGVFFQTDKKYYNCQLCPRQGCPNRKAPAEK